MSLFTLSIVDIMLLFIIGKKFIQFVGDSMTLDTHEALRQLVHNGHGGIECAHNLWYGRSHYLHFANKPLHKPFNDYVLQNNPDIVIMNSGAHLHRNDEIGEEVLPAVLRLIDTVEEQNRKRKNNKHIKYLFRGQYGGHMNCWEHSSPISMYNNTVSDSRHGSNTSVAFGWYNWHMFPGFDEDARRILKNNKKMQFLDMSPMYLRADSHRGMFSDGGLESKKKTIDCLHFALPGAMDFFARIIYHKLFIGEL